MYQFKGKPREKKKTEVERKSVCVPAFGIKPKSLFSGTLLTHTFDNPAPPKGPFFLPHSARACRRGANATQPNANAVAHSQHRQFAASQRDCPHHARFNTHHEEYPRIAIGLKFCSTCLLLLLPADLPVHLTFGTLPGPVIA